MTRFKITALNRPVETFARMSEPFSLEMQAESQVYQKQREALRQQFEREWTPPPGYSPEHDLEEMANIESAAFTVWEERRTGRTAAASTPVWVDPIEYWLINGPGFDSAGLLARLPTAASLKLPFMLKGGGDMQIAFETKKSFHKDFDEAPQTHFERKLWLRVRTEHGVSTGHLERECGERHWWVVSLPAQTTQAIADRIALTLDAINELKLPDDYLTVMPVSDRCSICARPLTDIVSKTLGIGPDCARKLKIPHSAAVADANIVKRRAYLATGEAHEARAAVAAMDACK